MPSLPVILVVVAAIAAAPAGWLARGLVFDLFEKPALVQQLREACAAQTEALAATARAAELARQAQAAEIAREEAERMRIEDEAEHAARIEQLNEEIAAYETDSEAGGRACPLTERDLDFLNRVRDH